MGGDEDVVWPGDGAYRYNHRCMGKNLSAVLKTELNEIAGAQKIHVNLNTHRAVSGLGPRHKVPEKLYARPGWGPVCGVDVIPAELRGEIHNASACVQALGRKIGAVAANLTKIVEGWITGIGPFVGIGNRRTAVIWEQLDHAASPPFSLFYVCRHFVDTALKESLLFCGF